MGCAMAKNNKSLKRSITIGYAIFIAFLCLILSLVTFYSHTQSLYSAYEERMTDLLNYVYYYIDLEDLGECCETFEPSDKYWELQDFMDRITETMDIHYLYIIIPPKDEDDASIYNVLSADTAYGRMYAPDGYYLGYLIEDMYTADQAAKYRAAMSKNEITFFEIESGWGDDYSGCMPLKDANGNAFALLCVDIDVSKIHKMINSYTFVNIILIMVIGVVFAVVFLYIQRFFGNDIKD